jgi:tetratricopeptide (TPR) repeat protein
MKKLKSPFCWQICGLLYKLAGNTSESAKAFDQALKFDPTNLQVLRDAANLYLHARNFSGHREMRRRLMMARPGILSHWAGFVFSCHLCDDFSTAIDGMESLLEVAKEDKSLTPIDWSNILLYKSRLYREANKITEQLAVLEANRDKILNKIVLSESLARCYLQLGDFEKAKKELNYLIEKMPENEAFVKLYIEVHKDKSPEENLKLLRTTYKNRVISLLLLKEVKNSEEFKQIFEEEFKENCLKFIPSYFRYIKSLLKDSSKAQIIEEFLNNNLLHWQEKGSLNVTLSETHLKLVDPTCELFLLYNLSQLYLWKGDLEKSLKLCNEAIDHTPTFEDVHVLRSNILRKQGNGTLACSEAQRWQTMNLGDRCLAKTAVRLLVKQNLNKEADKLFKRFMKDEKNTEKTLHELQKFNYELNLATSYAQELKFSHAIGLLNTSCKHFVEIFEDQYDFYSFCLRKFNFISLHDAIKFNDFDTKNLKSYIRAHSKLLHCFFLNKKYEKFNNIRLEQLKNDLTAENLALKLEEEKIQMQANTIEISQEIIESLDLHAVSLFKQGKVDDRTNEVAARLSACPLEKSKRRLATEAQSILFNHYIDSNSVNPLLNSFGYLLKNDQKSFENQIRKIQFDKKIEHFKSLAIKDKNLSEKLESFLKEYETLYQAASGKFVESYHNKDADFKKLISILIQQYSNVISEEQSVEQMSQYIKAELLPKIYELDLKVE